MVVITFQCSTFGLSWSLNSIVLKGFWGLKRLHLLLSYVETSIVFTPPKPFKIDYTHPDRLGLSPPYSISRVQWGGVFILVWIAVAINWQQSDSLPLLDYLCTAASSHSVNCSLSAEVFADKEASSF